MPSPGVWGVGGGVGVAAVLAYSGWLWTLLYLAYHMAIVTGVAFLAAKWYLVRGQAYRPAPRLQAPSLTSVLLTTMMEQQQRSLQQEDAPRKVVITRNLDITVQEVMDLVIRDYVLSWYAELCCHSKPFQTSLRSDMWYMVQELSNRLSEIDYVALVTQEVVDKLTEHFTNIRLATQKDGEKKETFALHAWLEDEESEKQYLRTLCEALLLILLPPTYTHCHSVRRLLREILTSSVLKPTIELLCDPDYLNQKLLAYLEYRQKLAEDTRRTYTYAATYEDFMKKIETCNDIEHLKQMRYNIMSEIMQAATINNLKKAQGINTDRESSPKSTSKGELLKARNLKRYINQLTVAKIKCERRIQALGGPDYKYDSGQTTDETGGITTLRGKKVLAIGVIMDIPKAREYFLRYLKKENKESLIGFWVAVERLRNIRKQQRHQLGSEVYQQFIAAPSSAVRLDKAIIKGMEAFLRGDASPEAFYQGQKEILKVLEEKYYPSFIVSDVYHQCISSLSADDEDPFDSLALAASGEDKLSDDLDSEEVDLLANESYQAKQRLSQLDEKITNKEQALLALRMSQKEDAKIKKVMEDMERELETLRGERGTLESRILRTQQWVENQGHWHVTIQEAEVQNKEDKQQVNFVLVIHLPSEGSVQGGLHNSRQGWVISRSLEDFHALHSRLIQIGPWLKKQDLPSLRTMIFKSYDKAFLEKAKATLDDYMVAVLKDERMGQSEALFTFLISSSEYMQKKKTSILDNFLKSLPSIRSEAQEEDDSFLFLGEDGDESPDVDDSDCIPHPVEAQEYLPSKRIFEGSRGKDDHSRDSIAKPLYRLVAEVFELRGVFKWLRKSFISFVEVTFGRSINRQLREWVDWLISESMLIYYIRTFQDSMWPDGVLAEALQPRTDEEKFQTRMAAKEKLLQSIPDLLKNLVGEANARQGMIKMFEVLQNVKLNKHLFYTLLEVVIVELMPELQKVKA